MWRTCENPIMVLIHGVQKTSVNYGTKIWNGLRVAVNGHTQSSQVYIQYSPTSPKQFKGLLIYFKWYDMEGLIV